MTQRILNWMWAQFRNGDNTDIPVECLQQMKALTAERESSARKQAAPEAIPKQKRAPYPNEEND